MRQAARGRGYQAEKVVWQAHRIDLQPGQNSNTLGFRLTTDALEETARGGSWKADVPFASVGWNVEEWPRQTHSYMAFRLARENVA